MDPSQIRSRLNAWTVLANGEYGVLFDRESMELKPLSQEIAEALGSLVVAANEVGPESSDWLDYAEIVQGVGELPGLEGLSAAVPEDGSVPLGATPDTRRLFKLAISVADTCNMACSYCYANRGHYERPAERIMSQEVAAAVVENAVQRFSAIDTVQFIGGEPSLNWSAIQRVCAAFSEAADSGRIPRLPVFVITTNGASISREMLQVAKSYGVRPTLSLDGPKPVHDELRRGPNGEPSYDRVRASADRFLEAGLPLDFEATFSKAHLRHGLHLTDLCQWFRDEFSHRVLHVPPVSGGRYVDASLVLSDEEKILEYCAAAEWGVDNLMQRRDWMADSYTARILEALARKSRSRSICSAGRDLVCVAADGSAYPCWMFTGEARFRLGTFLEPTPRPWDWADARDLFAPGDLDGEECKACWCRSLCFGCRGYHYRATGDLLRKHDCNMTRSIIASVIFRLFHPARTPGGRFQSSGRLPYGAQLYSQ